MGRKESNQTNKTKLLIGIFVGYEKLGFFVFSDPPPPPPLLPEILKKKHNPTPTFDFVTPHLPKVLWGQLNSSDRPVEGLKISQNKVSVLVVQSVIWFYGLQVLGHELEPWSGHILSAEISLFLKYSQLKMDN